MMLSWTKLALISLFLCLGQQVLSAEQTIDGVELLRNLCADDSHRIDDTESIAQLHAALNDGTLPEGDSVASCADKYRPYVKELFEIVGQREHSVCGFKLVSQISRFHWNYIIGQLDKKWSKKLASDLPQPLLLFFIDYANAVSKKCAHLMFNNVHQAGKHAAEFVEQMSTDTLGRLVDVGKFSIVQPEKVKNADDFLLLWHTAIDKLKRQGKVPLDKVNEEGDETITGFKVQEPKNIWDMQDNCRYKLRPIYQETTLPVMKLINMGYGVPMEEDWIAYDNAVKQWYFMTQYCELILPVAFYRDPSLSSNVGQILRTRKEAEGLEIREYKPREEIPSTKDVTMVHVIGKLSTSTQPKELKTNLRAGIKKRARLYRSTTKNLMQFMRHNILQSLKDMMHLGRKKSETNDPDEFILVSPAFDGGKAEKLLEATKEFADNENDEVGSDQALVKDERPTGLKRAKRDLYDLYDNMGNILIVLFILSFLVAICVFAVIGLIGILKHKIVFAGVAVILHG